MNDVHDFDSDDGIHGLWNRQRARLPRFDAAHRDTVLAAVADVLAAEPTLPVRRPGGLLVAAVAAAMLVALPSWLALLPLPSGARAGTAPPSPVSLVARAAAAGVALPTDGSGRLAAVTRHRETAVEEQAPGRGILRSIDVHALLDAPHFTLGETF